MVHSVYANMPMTVFEEMSGLARSLGAVNLGQGFPDAPGPLAIRQKAADAVLNGYNQYPPMVGLPEPIEEISKLFLKNNNFIM